MSRLTRACIRFRGSSAIHFVGEKALLSCGISHDLQARVGAPVAMFAQHHRPQPKDRSGLQEPWALRARRTTRLRHLIVAQAGYSLSHSGPRSYTRHTEALGRDGNLTF